MAHGGGIAQGRTTAAMILTTALLANVGREDVEHLTRGIEDQVALMQRVVFDRMPRVFGEERDHGFIASLGGALGVIGLREPSVSQHSTDGSSRLDTID